MRYRKLSPTGDYLLGQAGQFLVDSPEVVAQAIQTRLLLSTGEWFLDLTEGTPYSTEILGTGTQGSRDQAIKERILDTPGVVELVSYSSAVEDRRFSVSARVSTIYGPTTINVNLT
jgi:hypothetical protein